MHRGGRRFPALRLLEREVSVSTVAVRGVTGFGWGVVCSGERAASISNGSWRGSGKLSRVENIDRAVISERIQRYIALNEALRRVVKSMGDNLSCDFYLTGSSIRQAIQECSTYSDCDFIVSDDGSDMRAFAGRSGLELTRNSYGDLRFALFGVQFDVMSSTGRGESAVVDLLSTFDFSCNQIAYNPKTGNVIDPWGGVEDICHGRLALNRRAWVGVGDRLLVNQCARILGILRKEPSFDIDASDAEFLREIVLPQLSSVSDTRISERWCSGKEGMLLAMRAMLGAQNR